MNIKELLGKRIKELRHKTGMTQEEFADKINVAPRHVSRIENGINTPSIETLYKIAGILNVEIKELYNFNHLKDEKYLKDDIKEILLKLEGDNLVAAHKILNALFR